MIVPPLVALFAWVPISLWFFRRYPMRVALLINYVGGWAILPAANYKDPNVSFPYWILGTSLESDYFLTKATMVGLCGLIGVLLFDRERFKRFRLTVWDLPMGMWMIAPWFSSIANPGTADGLIPSEMYQILAWVSPYVIGRLYFTDTTSLRLAAKAFVIGGLAYIPFCLVEVFWGPHIYQHVYGYLPYQMIGAGRAFGYRPIGLLENGNMLGIWMATATLIAAWMWRRKITDTVLKIPILIVAISLFAVTLLCQSTGSIVLLLALLPFVFVDPRHLSRTVTILLVFAILGFGLLRISNVVSLRELAKREPHVHAVAGYLKSIGKGSLGWRLSQDERHITTALDEPLLGYGKWDWWRGGFERPWGLWLLAFGMYGLVGLLSLEALLLIPALRAVWFPLARSDIGYTNMRHMLSAAVLITAIDSLLNSAIILPLLIVIGGMTIWSTHDTEVEVELAKSRAAAGTPGWRGSANPRKEPRRARTEYPPVGRYR
jgi:hypothetical protein